MRKERKNFGWVNASSYEIESFNDDDYHIKAFIVMIGLLNLNFW